MFSFLTPFAVRPLIGYTNPLIETMEGRNVHMTCLVLLGNPPPTIMWFYMGERVVSSDKIHDDGQGNLILEDVSVDDEGEYTCVAWNVGGNATYITQLDVQGFSFNFYHFLSLIIESSFNCSLSLTQFHPRLLMKLNSSLL